MGIQKFEPNIILEDMLARLEHVQHFWYEGGHRRILMSRADAKVSTSPTSLTSRPTSSLSAINVKLLCTYYPKLSFYLKTVIIVYTVPLRTSCCAYLFCHALWYFWSCCYMDSLPALLLVVLTMLPFTSDLL